MTKQEVIIKEWYDLGINTPYGICNNTGWLFSYDVNGIVAEFSSIREKIEFTYEDSNITKWRPKSLSGIEDNNGWTKIESIDDLPEKGLCNLVVRETGEIVRAEISKEFLGKSQCIYYSHYKKIEIINGPLY